jgi:hypothetical protein
VAVQQEEVGNATITNSTNDDDGDGGNSPSKTMVETATALDCVATARELLAALVRAGQFESTNTTDIYYTVTILPPHALRGCLFFVFSGRHQSFQRSTQTGQSSLHGND